MKDSECVEFLQWALPRLRMRWRGFRRVRKQVCKRIDRRLRELGLSDVAAYRDYLDAHQEEWAQLDSFCRISISRFYRDRGVFDLLRDEVLPMVASMARARGDHTLRCWSAGCASGEEVYTLRILWALCLSTRFPDLTLRLVATDSDSNMLDRARRGCYSASSLKEVSQDWLTIAFTRSDDVFCVKPEFRDHIELRLQDIRRELPPEQFHVILCRHMVFNYFDEPLQCEMLDRLIARLVPGGILVTGKQEPLPRLPTQLEEFGCRMGIYRKGEAPAAASSGSGGLFLR